MNFTIKSKKNSEVFTFWASANGGYVYLERPGKPGTLGSQICRGGGFMGSTLSCGDTLDSLARVARAWYRQYMRA